VGKPAARVGDMHTCPMVDPGPKPHVGGPITGPGVPTVFIGGQPAAVVGDMATCTGPPDSIIMGSTGVFIGGKPAARMGDNTAHGGVIVAGCPTVLIGEVATVVLTPMAPGAGGGAGTATSGGTASAALAARRSAIIAGTGEGKKSEDETHWLDVKFVDKAGYPITGMDYELTGTDSKKSKGKLAGDGRIRKDGIDPGNATVQLFSVHNARWSKDKARVGDKVKLTADVVGCPAGTKAVFEIWERDINTPDDLITQIEAKTQSNKVETEWEYQYTEDVDDTQTEKEKKGGYSAPEYYFIVKVGSSKAKSGLLEYKDNIEIELRDGDDDPIPNVEYVLYLSNGEVRKGKLNAKGKACEEDLPNVPNQE
jgi:uncharacterized Zn-binding protein involved in type VI secretion